MRHREWVTAGLVATFLGGAVQAQSTTLVSKSSAGIQGDRSSQLSAICASGRRVVFSSEARNLVPGDSNFISDVFVHDRRTGVTTRVSVDSAGVESNGYSGLVVDLSAEGDHALFLSAGSNLVPNDTNGEPDLFVHDLRSGLTSRVNVATDGTQANALSFYGSISGDGRVVAFDSGANNLVPADTNKSQDVFVHDCQTGVTVRVSVASDGSQSNAGSNDPALSADGRLVAFTSWASNLDPQDFNGVQDIFVHDRTTGQTMRVANGNRASRDSSLSADGRYVAFASDATNLVPGDTNNAEDVFLHDLRLLLTWRASVHTRGDQALGGDSSQPTLSEDGRCVVFTSRAANLVDDDQNGNQDVFVHDRVTGRTWRASVSSLGVEANQNSWDASIGADGSRVAFASAAANLVPGDVGPWTDLFVHGPEWTLEAEPPIVAPGAPFALTTWTGTSQSPALLAVTRVDDTWFPLRLAVGRFDAVGEWRVNLAVPATPLYQGIDLAFQAYAIAPSGAVVATNEEFLGVR